MAQVPATRQSQSRSMAPRNENPLDRLRRDFDAVFGRLAGGLFAPFEQDFEAIRLWDFDVNENDKEIIVRAEIPGFDEKELDVQLDRDVLTIKAEKEQKGNGHEEYRSYSRSVTLPPGINPEKVQATYTNGVLELHIPRAEGAQPKRISVQGQQGAAGQQGKQSQQATNQAGATASGKAQK
jgi:HSP20 family protein